MGKVVGQVNQRAAPAEPERSAGAAWPLDAPTASRHPAGPPLVPAPESINFRDNRAIDYRDYAHRYGFATTASHPRTTITGRASGHRRRWGWPGNGASASLARVGRRPTSDPPSLVSEVRCRGWRRKRRMRRWSRRLVGVVPGWIARGPGGSSVTSRTSLQVSPKSTLFSSLCTR